MKPTNKCRYFSKLLPKPRRTDMDWDVNGMYLEKYYFDKQSRAYKYIITWLGRDYECHTSRADTTTNHRQA